MAGPPTTALKRGSKKSSRGGKSARAPGLLSALQDDTEENLFSLYFVTRFIAFKKKTKKKHHNQNVHIWCILLFVSKLHPILNPMCTGHELERSMIVFLHNHEGPYA